MNFRELNIPIKVIDFFKQNRKRLTCLQHSNELIQSKCGVISFFNSTAQLEELREVINENETSVQEPDRREYGDFQTSEHLALECVRYILSKTDTKFEFVLEPTCGKGNFILAALSEIIRLKKLVGIEIYQPYVWETKFNILNFYIKNPQRPKPETEIFHANVFDFDFEMLSRETKSLAALVIGNPPWVTNSELGAVNSKNLPQKSNVKKHSGLDAITGKGNFDIGEYIALMMLRNFSSCTGYFGFLIKNSVVKNLLYDQKQNKFSIGEIEKLNIDSKKEFNVSVDACFFLAELGHYPASSCCTELDFYTKAERTRFGWFNDQYVYSVSGYQAAKDIEGVSPFVWRQGIKHDCTQIMEIETCNGHYKNGLNIELEIENDLVFGLLKSSDLKEKETNSYRKLTIVTQKKIGQSTDYIKKDYPRTFAYLNANRHHFEKRKSSIYKGKPEFSIFGVGDYSFALYKIAISGLYKRTQFTFVMPDNGKPIMLDDTCYFIGFENLIHARIAHCLLNCEYTQQFLKAVIFPDAKRSVTKDILMRIDFVKLYNLYDFNLIQRELDLTLEEWESFGEMIHQRGKRVQMTLF